jgi:dipeptidyl aminopeptidase/acylaminoacyl peptidase
MTTERVARSLIVLIAFMLPCAVGAQGTPADYARAATIADRFRGLTVDEMDGISWIGDSDGVVYRKSVKGGHQFVIADPATATKRPAFDHARLAAALSSLTGAQYSALTLPFTTVVFDDPQHIAFDIQQAGAGRGRAAGGTARRGTPPPAYHCSLTDYTCSRAAVRTTGARSRSSGAQADVESASPGNEESPAPLLDQDGNPIPDEGPWDDGWHNGADAFAVLAAQQQGRGASLDEGVRVAPDGSSEAIILNYNVYLRPTGASTVANAVPLTTDGSEGNFYTLQSVSWSPDSKHLVAYRVIPGYRREIHYHLSSPPDQLQPKDTTLYYAKPGDRVDFRQPVLVDVAARRAAVVDNALFPNAYSISPARWWADSRAFTFEYNQRGHQVYRVIEVNATTGAPRVLIDERSKTFVNYRRTNASLSDAGRTYRYDVADGKEIVWMSERDGWAQLYLYDGATGQVKNQITKGHFVVRAVDRVDEAKRQIWFEAGGMNPTQDPYFLHYYRINFDGTGLTTFTDADGNHSVVWSPDGRYYVDTWSRVDLPPQGELRRTSDQKVVMELEHGDASAAIRAGLPVPEVFVAKGRDGVTDIWGTIQRPATFDPKKKYAVIENIYAGPQGSFVQKTWSDVSRDLQMAEAGYIVVHIDGMGTNNRSKAFHDVAWKNLGDAGFPDRILWHKAVAAKYPWYDISRVGIFGTSAGGQNAMGAVLFHPEFYKAAFANSGCHDNRMDKIWWNEQWMGWPVDSSYDKSSNLLNAYRLKGHLILVQGEFDTNVDPSVQTQVANALIKSNKDFEFIVVPNGGHGSGGAYVAHKRDDMFNKVFYNVDAPDRNAADAPPLGPFGRAPNPL